VAATNPGHAVSPSQIEAQIDGSFAHGLGAALMHEITLSGGRGNELNSDTYPMITMREMPPVESIVMPSYDFWGGVGEPTISLAAPAVLKALYRATGERAGPSGDQPHLQRA
jgi:isoquinoline 1-oxidoreductase subunit beta